MTDDAGYLTLAGYVRHEPEPIKGSRHIATAAPVGSEADANALLQEVRQEMPKANHHCFAWRLAPDARELRCSDDGEPSGTAGRPILRVLENQNVLDAIVVVSRFFGGVKLGAGGLARAYSGAAVEVLEAAELVEVVPMVRLSIRVAYPDEPVVRQVLREMQHEVADSAHDARVTLRVELREDASAALMAELIERTHGRAEIDRSDL